MGALEVIVGIALLLPLTRVPAAVVAALLGAGFAALGIAGRLRSSTLACGCLGQRSGRPLGIPNVAVGVALVAVMIANLALGAPDNGYGSDALVLGALCTLTACLLVHRNLIAELTRDRREVTQ